MEIAALLRSKLTGSAVHRSALCVISGALLAIAFPKFDIGALAWVALIPLLVAIEGRSLPRVFGYASLQGLVFYTGLLYWIAISLHTEAHVGRGSALAATVILAGVEALFVGGTLAAAEFTRRRLSIPVAVTLPIAWPAFEWLRSFFPIGFPWGLLGYAAHRDLRLVQFSEVTGIYGVSALIVLVNAALYQLIFRSDTYNARLRTAAVAGGLVIFLAGFGSIRMYELGKSPAAGELKVAMVQGDIPQSAKWNPASMAPTFKVYSEESEAAARQRPGLVIWPETAADFLFQPNSFYPVALEPQQEYKKRLLELARNTREPILFGAPAIEFNPSVSTRNRAYLVSAEGRVSGYYDKILLVPFGEYVPATSVFGHYTEKVTESLGDITSGNSQTILDVKDARIGVLICYESIFPDFTRRAVKQGANILVNITNDAWFGRTSAPYQLLTMAAMRSIETHTPMVRVANTGFSAVISATGRISGRTKLFQRLEEVQTVSWKRTRTVYTQVGDVFSEMCFALVVVGLGLAAYGVRLR